MNETQVKEVIQLSSDSGAKPIWQMGIRVCWKVVICWKITSNKHCYYPFSLIRSTDSWYIDMCTDVLSFVLKCFWPSASYCRRAVAVRPTVYRTFNQFFRLRRKVLKTCLLGKELLFFIIFKSFLFATASCFTGKNDKSRNVGSIPRWVEIPHSCCSLFINNCDQWNIARTLFFGAVCIKILEFIPPSLLKGAFD